MCIKNNGRLFLLISQVMCLNYISLDQSWYRPLTYQAGERGHFYMCGANRKTSTTLAVFISS